MGNTPEAKVKNIIKNVLKTHNVYYVMPIGSGYGKSGVPDFICCYKGYFFAIEAKAGNNTPTKLQEINLQAINNAGGVAIVVNENAVENITGWLKILDTKAQ
ncbi:VRR-NUC domain-containing protein [bacterium]|nr:VRR-NUC domain-containing protein [bacterium]